MQHFDIGIWSRHLPLLKVIQTWRIEIGLPGDGPGCSPSSGKMFLLSDIHVDKVNDRMQQHCWERAHLCYQNLWVHTGGSICEIGPKINIKVSTICQIPHYSEGYAEQVYCILEFSLAILFRVKSIINFSYCHNLIANSFIGNKNLRAL